MLGRLTSARRQDAEEIPCPLPMAIFAVRRMDVRFEQRVNIKFCVKLGKTATSPVLPWSLSVQFFLFPRLKKRLKERRHENIEAKWLWRWSSQAFWKRHSPAAFRTYRNAGNSVLTVEGTTLRGTGSISCEDEFCIFYRLSLRTLRTKDVFFYLAPRASQWAKASSLTRFLDHT
jgi:hypothetical protein